MSRTLVTTLLLLLLAGSGCKEESTPPASPRVPAGREQPNQRVGEQVGGQVAPAIHLKVYPDMAVPGKEVVIEVELVPDVVSEVPRYHFRTVDDPCHGKLEQNGRRVVYHVPSDCRGSDVDLEVLVTGSFGELRETVTLDIKKTSFMDSVVFTYPLPGQRATAPISVWWDRSLYHNRQEKLSFRVKRFERFILDTGQLSPEMVVELDIPPSPDEIVLYGETSTGSRETALVRVYRRLAPEWPSNALLVDRFSLPDMNSLDAPRKVLREGGEVDVGTAYRISADGREPFLFLHYHVSKSKRYGPNEALMGIEEEVPVRATRAGYKWVWVWLRGDPVHGSPTPVYVRVTGSRGASKDFKIKRVSDNWKAYRFPLYRALRSSDERVRSISVFVDAKDVTPPLGTILFGGLYLEPHKVDNGESD